MSIEVLINSIIEAYGGQSVYAGVDKITVKWHFTGAVLGIKGRPGVLVPTTTIYTKEQKVVHRGLGGGSDEEWIFTPSRVWKQRISDSVILEARDDPRAAFAGHQLDTPWDDFHFTYFCGYAMWQYFNFPFLLARDDIATRQPEPHEENGEKWRVLEVTYPDQDAFASHTKTQKYYFSNDFILQRHDYAPDVLAGAPAAHYVYDEVRVGKILFPTMRRIVSIDPARDTPLYHGPIPTLINIVLHGIELHNGKESDSIARWDLVQESSIE